MNESNLNDYEKSQMLLALAQAQLPQADFIATTRDGEVFTPLWIDLDVINLTHSTSGYGRTVVSLYDAKTVARLIRQAINAARLIQPTLTDTGDKQ